jgi:hypothetical protein
MFPRGDFWQTDEVRSVRFQTVARQSGDRSFDLLLIQIKYSPGSLCFS